MNRHGITAEWIDYLISECTSWGKAGDFDYEIFDKDKFARLIVDECLGAIDPTGDLTSMREECERLAAMQMIRNHFGIKE